MGIHDEDITRVREATDFVAIVSEHIALKRVGRQYQGLCPFHSEKSPSFSINPEKGVYYCYGCQASGDVISFVRELEHLDFGQAIERLAAKANITLRYDNEAAGRDRVRRTKLVDAMERSVDWYHQRLLSGTDAGQARGYLRSRGFTGDQIRQFRIGYAPAGWDVLCRSLSLPTDVARDTGLGYVNKIGKVNDFFQNRILFPIFDQSGSPVAFGGRKLPTDDGPKYKNSSETKLYSKSRILYGLNWAKTSVVETGEVIVCEGYTDVIGFHTAGIPRAVATCGTALADEHFRTLKNYARRIVLAYDADNAGQSAAEKFYAWEKQYEIDLFVVALPEGADPADFARSDPQALRSAVKEAKPFLAFRIDRALRAATLTSPEGRSKGFESAAALVMEHPSAIVREQYLREVASRCQVSETHMLATLETYGQGRVKPRRDAKTRSEPPTTAKRGEVRAIANSDPHDHGYEPYPDHYFDDAPRHAPPYAPRHPPPITARGTRTSAPTSPQTPSTRVKRGAASSASVRAELVASRSRPAEEELVRWYLHDPSMVHGWMVADFFVDPIANGAVRSLIGTSGDLHRALEYCETNNFVPEAQLIRRLVVDSPSGTEFEDALALVVSNASDRVIGVISGRREQASAEELRAIGDLKLLQEDLRDPIQRADALMQLVPWLAQWYGQQQEGSPQMGRDAGTSPPPSVLPPMS